MVERHVGRRAHDHERPVAVDRELPEHGLVGLEVGQVVLLLQPGVAAQLAARPVAVEALGRDRVGHHDGARQPAVHVVLGHGELVVERRGARDPQQRGGHRHVVRAVPDRHVEAPAARPAREREAARREPHGLAAAAAAAVAAHRRVLDPEALAELERLGEVARGHLHLVPVLAHRLDQRPQHQHVRAVGQIGPDTHRSQLPYFALMPLIASITDPIVNAAVDVVDAMGLPGVFLLMVLESACIPIPSEATMLFAGFNVSNGEYSLFAAVAVGLDREPGRLLDRLLGRLLRAAWTSSRSTARSCTSRRATSSGPTAGSSATATPPSSSRACCRSSAPSSRCPPAWRACPSGASACSRSPAACPWVLMLTFIGKQAGDNWEDWKDSLHYVDYAVAAMIVGGVAYLIVRARGARRGTGGRRHRDHLSERLPLREALALGLLQGVTELVPVSSSAHLALVPRLLGWRYAGSGPRRAQGVRGGAARRLGARAGAGGGRRRRRARARRCCALTVLPPAAGRSRARAPDRAAARRAAHGGARADRRPARRSGSPTARRASAPTPDAGDHLAVGMAQALALAPGVSRAGAALTAARLRGLDRPAAAGAGAPGGAPGDRRRGGAQGLPARPRAARPTAVPGHGGRRGAPRWPRGLAARRLVPAGGGQRLVCAARRLQGRLRRARRWRASPTAPLTPVLPGAARRIPRKVRTGGGLEATLEIPRDLQHSATPCTQPRARDGWTERTSARLVEDMRALLRVDAVAFVTVDEERGLLERAAGWFATPELSEALQPRRRAGRSDRGRRGLVEAALERARPLLLPRVEAWEAAPDLLADLMEALGEDRAREVWGSFRMASVIAWRLRTAVGQPLGVILLASLDPSEPLDTGDLRSVEVVADLTAMAHGARGAARGGGHARAPRAAAQARRRGGGRLARAGRGAPPRGGPRGERDRREQGAAHAARLARPRAAGGGERGLLARRRRGPALARRRRRGRGGALAHGRCCCAATRPRAWTGG